MREGHKLQLRKAQMQLYPTSHIEGTRLAALTSVPFFPRAQANQHILAWVLTKQNELATARERFCTQ